MYSQNLFHLECEFTLPGFLRGHPVTAVSGPVIGSSSPKVNILRFKEMWPLQQNPWAVSG